MSRDLCADDGKYPSEFEYKSVRRSLCGVQKAVIDVLVQPVNAHSEREQTCCPGEGHNCGINTSEFRVLTKKRPGAQSSYALKRIIPGKTRINPGKTSGLFPENPYKGRRKGRKVKYSVKGKVRKKGNSVTQPSIPLRPLRDVEIKNPCIH